jgi:ribose/xylose/arabinose/galactoside ABC-type transport system permease subunit
MMEKPQTESLLGDVEAIVTPTVNPKHPLTGLGGFLRRNRNAVGALGMFLFFWIILLIFSDGVFQNPIAYTSIFTTLPITILLVVAVIFTTTNGAIDLSYTSSIGLGAFAFAYITNRAVNPELAETLGPWFISPEAGPWVGFLVAIMAGALVGVLNSFLVLRFRLTPFIATLGVQFFIRGLIVILSNAKSIPAPFIAETTFFKVCCGQAFATSATGILERNPDSGFIQFFGTLLERFPNQMIWAVLFFAITWLLFSKHTIGRHTRIVGDNEESAREMGIPINRVKSFSYIYTGIAAAMAGAMFVGTFYTFWPDTGSSYLLTVLTAVFVGGNPLVGGMGTVAGAFIGAVTVAFIETGLIAMGFVDVYTQFVYGIVLIISLLGFRTRRR